jgi:pimeloyl-ACP methyl ester carboxylesterase
MILIVSWLQAALTVYFVIEVAFYIAFYYYMIPEANKLREPAPYRDYGKDRHKLLLRIMKRMKESCDLNDTDSKADLLRFLSECFHSRRNPDYEAPNITTATPSSSPENSDDEGPTQEAHSLYKEDMDDFFSWAFFGKLFTTLLEWERQELDLIYHEIEKAHDLIFPPKVKHTLYYHSKPRCMSLEPVNCLYRPLLVYLIVDLVKFGGSLLLFAKGYERLVASTGLVAWHRPATAENNSTSLMPLLFFHGIAPGGLMLYLPMLFGSFANEPDRPVFFFENRSISCSLDFTPLTEQQTVDGVVEILEKFQHDTSKLSLVGHSFGSCPVTWLLASKRLPNIKQIVLLDPVTILLSEPDVMVNFLYAEEISKIRMVASSELFTEYYLRRHFSWYNSELWLESVTDCEILVCLGEKDEIINAGKVKGEVERHSSGRLIYWKGAGHADCVVSPSKWKQVKNAMLEQELKIAQER